MYYIEETFFYDKGKVYARIVDKKIKPRFYTEKRGKKCRVYLHRLHETHLVRDWLLDSYEKGEEDLTQIEHRLIKTIGNRTPVDVTKYRYNL